MYPSLPIEYTDDRVIYSGGWSSTFLLTEDIDEMLIN